MPTIDIREFEDAVKCVSSPVFRNEAFVCKATGKIYLVSDEFENSIEGESPDHLDDDAKYIPVADKRSLDLGSALVFAFALKVGPDYYEEISDVFRRKGAYSQFKASLEEGDCSKECFEFERLESRRSFVAWCTGNGFELEPNTRREATNKRNDA